jgi:hypothetical protein
MTWATPSENQTMTSEVRQQWAMIIDAILAKTYPELRFERVASDLLHANVLTTHIVHEDGDMCVSWEIIELITNFELGTLVDLIRTRVKPEPLESS